MNKAEDLMDKIEEIRDFLLARGRLTVSFTGSDSAYGTVSRTLSEWVGMMREERIAEMPTGFAPFETSPREGLAGPIQVAHCAKVIPAPHASHPDQTLLTLGAHIVRLDYIMNEIRFKGNAYGGLVHLQSAWPNPLSRFIQRPPCQPNASGV